MTKLSNKQHEQQQDQRLGKLEKRVDNDGKVVAKLIKRITSLQKQVQNLKKES